MTPLLRLSRGRRRARALSLIALLSFLSFSAACEEAGIPGPDLERMIEQERYQAYDASEFFADGRAMRSPPEGTVALGITLDPAVAEGVRSGVYVDRIPLPVTGALLARGQQCFEITCSACHGIAGDGESWVARKMELRKPPSLVDPRVRSFPDGRIYQVIQVGYGLMRSYVEDLDQEDRWAVVAYVRALQIAADVPLDVLPPALRERAEQELR
jgi:mono/diheme cytochrome c family protein